MPLYLITHAHTHARPDQDATLWHLSEQGQTQAEALSRQPFWPQVDYVVVSAEPKTLLTLQPILAHRNLPVVRDARFNELVRGGWDAGYTAHVAATFANPEQSVDGWEAAATALARFRAGIDNLTATTPGAIIALVGHGLTFSLYRAFLLGQEQVHLDDWRKLSFAAVAQVDPTTDTLLTDFTPVAGDAFRGG